MTRVRFPAHRLTDRRFMARRLVALGVALVSGLGAAYLVSGKLEQGSAPEVVVIEKAPQMVDILVATTDIARFAMLEANLVRWQPWPAAHVPDDAILRGSSEAGLERFAGNLVRHQVVAGEPLRHGRLLASADEAGLLATLITPGMRAVAIPIESRGGNAAGGFIQPDDRVDVIHVFRLAESREETAAYETRSQTLLRDVRVLAIGQNLLEQVGGRNVQLQGETATLELSPAQSELIARAQREGHLSLALRSFADRDNAPHIEPEAQQRSVTVRAASGSGFRAAQFQIAKPPVLSPPPVWSALAAQGLSPQPAHVSSIASGRNWSAHRAHSDALAPSARSPGMAWHVIPRDDQHR